MIGTTLQQVSRARSSKVGVLALFLTLSLMAHGLFFLQEWIYIGFALSLVIVLFNLLKPDHGAKVFFDFGLTDVLILGMILCSLLGLLHPVKIKDGFMETLRWGVLWLVYRLGREISADEAAQKRLVQYIEWLGIGVAIIGWLPGVSKVAGRLSSVFGYPNATAAFLGAVLLLCPLRKPFARILLGISFLCTGSRAGVGIFVVVLVCRYLLLGLKSTKFSLNDLWRLKFRTRVFKDRKKILRRFFIPWLGKAAGSRIGRLGTILLVGTGAACMLLNSKNAWQNLTSWSFSLASWQERLVYFNDGIRLAWKAGGLPRAGGWMAFPTIQHFPYWTADPHSSFIHILLNQGLIGVLCIGLWSVQALVQVWRNWAEKPLLPRTISKVKTEVPVGGTLLYLGLHSMVDADISFGALGILFWMLYGSVPKRGKPYSFRFLKWDRLVNILRRRGNLYIGLTLCLVTGSILFNPGFLEKETMWNTQARLGYEQNPAHSIELWNRSLNWDQTQTGVRREQAELLLKSGNIDAGLPAVEEVLRWQSQDIEAYEWAQSVVWNAAEVQRRIHPEVARKLYFWVESIPQKIEARAASISGKDRLLWKGYRDFRPSQHIKLLGEYARQRQLTQPLPFT